MKNVLFLVTGKTTPIITETVWALACNPEEPEPWIPDEIHVLSTEEGLDHIRMELFDNNGSPVFDQFKKDYPQLKDVYFNGEDCLHVFQDENGNKLSDLRTPKDNEIAADLICQKVREFTDDDNTSLHVSIAGGRKTMGFYAGYALSLYGRAQDSMSHVLVEERFENAEGFFYPTPKDSNIIIKNRAGKPVRTSEAHIWLAEIPFVRMRDAIIKKHQLNPENDKSFSETVQAINKSFLPVQLTLNVKTKKVKVNDQEIVLPPLYFAFLHWFADSHVNKKGIKAPINNSEDYASHDVVVKKFKEWSDPFNALYGLQSSSDDRVVDKKYFERTKSKLHKDLAGKLGSLELANRIMPIKNEETGEFEISGDVQITIINDK